MPKRARRVGVAAAVLVVVAAVVAAVLTGVIPTPLDRLTSAGGPTTPSPGAGRSAGTAGSSPATTPTTTTPSSSTSTPVSQGPGAAGDAAPGLSAVLSAPGKSPGLDAAALRSSIAAVDTKELSGKIGVQVIDAASGKVAYSRAAGSTYAPASTTKLLTTTAVLDLLGPSHRFTTRVVKGGSGQIILVGGGDPYLATKTDTSKYPVRPSLQQLAASTARALKSAHQTKVSLGYDASLFSGPSWNPKWPTMYHDQVSPVSALWADEGRTSGYSPGPRVSNPARSAAQAFGDALESRGIDVGTIAPAKASSSATPLASLQSLPLELIVEKLLMSSDNDAAEVMLRQAALAAGQPGSFHGGVTAVQHTLTQLGVWEPGTAMYDGSGLTRDTRVSPAMMVDILRLDASDARPKLRAVITGLPIAGVAGSLKLHYNDTGTTSARGLVRAKTGTLSGVHALAGYVRTKDGATAVFDVVVNQTKNDYVAEIWEQRVTAAIGNCC